MKSLLYYHVFSGSLHVVLTVMLMGWGGTPRTHGEVCIASEAETAAAEPCTRSAASATSHGHERRRPARPKAQARHRTISMPRPPGPRSRAGHRLTGLPRKTFRQAPQGHVVASMFVRARPDLPTPSRTSKCVRSWYCWKARGRDLISLSVGLRRGSHFLLQTVRHLRWYLQCSNVLHQCLGAASARRGQERIDIPGAAIP